MAVRRPAPKAPAPVAPAPKAAAPKAAAPKAAPAVVAVAPAKTVEVKAVEAKAPAAKAVAPKPVAAKPVAAAAVVDLSGIEANISSVAAKALEQGRAAYDQAKVATEEATQTLQASFAATSKGASELAVKALDSAKTNANAVFDHLKALATAKNIAEAISLHGEFIRAQGEIAVAQAKEFAELAKKAADETAAPIQAQMKKVLNKG